MTPLPAEELKRENEEAEVDGSVSHRQLMRIAEHERQSRMTPPRLRKHCGRAVDAGCLAIKALPTHTLETVVNRPLRCLTPPGRGDPDASLRTPLC